MGGGRWEVGGRGDFIYIGVRWEVGGVRWEVEVISSI